MSNKPDQRRGLAVINLASLLFYVLLTMAAEGIQYLLPYRSFNMMDMLLNVRGVVLGNVAYIDKYFK